MSPTVKEMALSFAEIQIRSEYMLKVIGIKNAMFYIKRHETQIKMKQMCQQKR